VRRRDLVMWLVAALFAGRAAQAQLSSTKLPRIGILSPAESDSTAIFAAFRDGLHALGYVEDRNLVLEYRFARGDYTALPRLAGELVQLPVDVIVTDGGTTGARAAMVATKTIPIVMGAVSDPVENGLVASLSRPGGNVTGFTISELSAKRMDLLRAAFPNAASVVVIFNPAASSSATFLRMASDAARSLGLPMITIEIASPEALHALRTEVLRGPGAPVVVLPDAMFWNHRREIVSLVAAARVPAIYPERDYADDGGLIAYGANVPDNFRRAAGYVDRILKGAHASDLPIQEPAKFDFIVNLKTARSLGLDLPPTFLARADEVIE
jgi:putative tryptophan/tyrosine transport system substrate-binding protein